MIGFLLLLLAVAALLSAIHGRGVAQGLVTGVFMLGSVAVGAFTLFIGFLILVTPSWRTQEPVKPYVFPPVNAYPQSAGTSAPAVSSVAPIVPAVSSVDPVAP